jgi:hypothetical protein
MNKKLNLIIFKNMQVNKLITVYDICKWDVNRNLIITQYKNLIMNKVG